MRPNVRTNTDPLNISSIPPTAGMELDYRTSVASERQQASSTTYALIGQASLFLLVALAIRAAAVFATTWVVFAVSLFVCGLLALVFYLKRDVSLRAAAKLTLLGPLLCGCGYLVATLPGVLMLALPVAAVAWLAHQIIAHYAAWMHANPYLDRPARQAWKRVWWIRLPEAGRRRGPITITQHLRYLFRGRSDTSLLPKNRQLKTEVTERAHYPAGFAIIFGAYLLAAATILAARAPFVGPMLGLLLFALGLLGWGVYSLHQYDPRADFLFAGKLTWKAICSWCAYNAHGTLAPGVFLSPEGHARVRHAKLAWTLAVTCIVALPLSSYFPIGVAFAGLGPWIRVSGQDLPFLEDDPELLQAELQVADDVLDAYLPTLLPGQRDAYITARSGDVERYTRQRVAHQRLIRAPEAILFASLAGVLRGDPVVVVSLILSVFTCLLVPAGLCFCVCYGLGARVLTHHWRTLEGDDEQPGLYQTRDRSNRWAAYVARLQESRHYVPDENNQPLRESAHLLLGFSIHGDYPVLLDHRILREHAHITGDTGAGKTALGLAPLISQLIGRPNSSVVVLDLNGEMPLFVNTREAVREFNEGHPGRALEYRWFTNFPGRSTYLFNPFLQSHVPRVTAHQHVEIILQSLGLEYGEGYGPAWFSAAHRHVLARIIEHNPDLNSFRKIDKYITKALPSTYKELGITKKQYEDGSHLYTVMHSLAAPDAVNATPDDGTPDEVFQRRIDMGAVVERPQVVYFSLVSGIEEKTTAEVARLALFSLLAAAVRRGSSDFTVYVVVDEFQQIVTENLEIILEQARHNGLNCILAHQNISQLNKPPAGNLIPVVQGNTRFKQVFSAADLAHQQAIMDASGEAMYHMAQWKVAVSDFTEGRLHKVQASHDLFAPEPAISVSENIGPALRRNDIIGFSDNPLHSLVHVARSRGFTQFGGYTFPMRGEYHIPYSVFRKREFSAWPEAQPGTVPFSSEMPVPSSAPPVPSEPTITDPVEQQRSQMELIDDLERRIEEIERV